MKAALHFLFGFLAFFAFSNVYFAQSSVTENQSYYKVISDPSEVQEIVKRCALESRCLDEYYKKPHPEDTKIDLPKLKQLLRDENPAIQAAGLNWIGVESWRTGEIYDQEVIALVKACLKNLSCYQQYAIRAIAIVDPANASNELLALLAKDSLNLEDRQSAKYALGELKASPESIQYFMGKLSQTKRSIFEQSDVQFEFNALCALYATASSDQQNEIFAFISDFVEKDSSYTLYPLIRAWLKNPAPALLPTMEALIWEELKDQRGYINESLAATVLSQKGKTGKKLAKEILGQDIAHYAMTVLPWAVQNGEGKMVEEIISRLASDSYFMKDLVDDLFEIGGRSLVDRFVEKVVDDEKRKFAKTYSTIQFDSLSPQHPMMRFNDTLVSARFIENWIFKDRLGQHAQSSTSKYRKCLSMVDAKGFARIYCSRSMDG